MTVEEFVKNFMKVNGIKGSVKDIMENITKEARKKAKNGVAVLDEEDIEKIILGIHLEPAKEVEFTEEPVKAEPKKKKVEPKKKKVEPKKEPDIVQMSLFDM